MLESWSISRRIGSGFTILTLMLVGLALFSHRSVGALGNGYSDYRATALQGVYVREAMEDLFEAKIATLSYVEKPVSDVRDAVIGNLDEVINNPGLTKEFDPASDHGVELNRLIELTALYRDRFLSLAGQLVDERTLQADLDLQSAMMIDSASSVFSTAVQNGNPPVVTAAGRVLQATMRTTLQSKQYKLSSISADLDTFVAEDATLERAIRQLRAIAPSGPVGAQLAELTNARDGFADKMMQFSQAKEASLQLQNTVIGQIGPEVDASFDRIADELRMRQDQLGPRGATIVAQLQTIIPTVGVAAVIVAILASLFIGRWITGTVSRLVDTTERLAAYEDDIEVTGTEHKHDLSRMARALLVFRDAQIERKEASAEREKLREQQDNVVGTMKSELAQLAAGDLTAQIEGPFADEYEDLRHNFNEAVSALQSAISRVSETAQGIGSTTIESNSATNDLSHRTENQAATLEETAAALDQLTASVKSAADHAKSVDSSVARARAEAKRTAKLLQVPSVRWARSKNHPSRSPRSSASSTTSRFKPIYWH
ncbi:methyl-accepting chemotaxis protein [Yoonia sp. GPGPB17]|uniref:methyl-accepting chemotaxis protein n=1 Tax=Yoonia sp. GPGPB17 TaxID=3026147 RepID=UPI0030BC0C3B